MNQNRKNLVKNLVRLGAFFTAANAVVKVADLVVADHSLSKGQSLIMGVGVAMAAYATGYAAAHMVEDALDGEVFRFMIDGKDYDLIT